MKAVVINQYGSKEVLEEAEVTLPELSEHQVMVKEYATSINPIDWKLREGYLKQMFDWPFPIILGWDVAGVITEVGSQVKDWQVGDKVFARPETISFEEAAAVPLAGLTAWQALFDHGHLKEGETVLIHAGAGGVGTYAIQLAKDAGAHVITTASEKNHALLKKIGADEVIDYHTTNFAEVLADIDLVFDTMGGEVQKNSFNVLKPNTGRLVSIVGIEDEQLATEKNISAESIWLQPNGEQLQKIADLMAAGKVKSIIGEVCPFSRQGIYDAHALSETHHAVGKIVVKMTE